MDKVWIKVICWVLFVFLAGWVQAEETQVSLWQTGSNDTPVVEEAALAMLAEARAATDVSARLSALSVLLEAYPEFFDAWIERGILRGKHGDLNGSLADFDIARNLRSDDILPLCNRAYVHILQGNLQEARKDYEQAIELSPSKAILFNGLGYVLFLMKKYPEAIQAFDQAVYLDPVNSFYFQNRAKTHEAMGHKREAKKDRQSSKKLEGLQYVTEDSKTS